MRIYARKPAGPVAFAGGNYPQGKVGAQVGSNQTPRDDGSTLAIKQLNQSQQLWWVPDGAAPLRPAFRVATYNQNWEGLRTWNSWQNMVYPNEYRKPLRDQSTQFVLNVARTDSFRRPRAPTPIAIRQYALNTRATTTGSFRPVRPKAGM